jgi:hypothetical protein
MHRLYRHSPGPGGRGGQADGHDRGGQVAGSSSRIPCPAIES